MVEKVDVKKFWDKRPCRGYDSFHNRNNDLANELKNLDFGGHKGEMVLEVGCGTGFEPISYALGGSLAVGLDMSHESLNLAKARASDLNVSVDWVLGDAENSPFRDEAFDFISSIGVLHHTPRTNIAIGEIHRELQSGAKAVVMLYNRDSLQILFLSLRRIPLQGTYDYGCPLVKFYGRNDIPQLFRGFKTVESRAYGLPDKVRSTNVMKRSARVIISKLVRALEPWIGWAHYITVKKG